MPNFLIARANPTDTDAAELIGRHLAQMAAQSPEESCHAMDGAGLSEPGVEFYILRRDDLAIAMGALKPLSGGDWELKSMHTAAEARGSGAGRAMLDYLLGRARAHEATAIYLETGSTAEFEASRSLYESCGFVRCPPFGTYQEDPWSMYMRLDLRKAT